MDFGNWIQALKMATLLVGAGYYYTYDIQRYVYPFTPIELHSGYMLGKERVIATHSGSYGWPDAKNLVQVRHFDLNGKLTDKDFKTRIVNEARTETEVVEGEAVVLVKLPVQVTSKQGIVTVHGVQYGPRGLKFAVEAAKGFSMQIYTGEMAVKPGLKFKMKIYNVSKTVSANKSGVLKIDIDPAPSSMMVEVSPL
jgi:hypothetical protein